MLSLDLFDSRFEKKLHEGAVDSTIEHLLKPLSLRAADIRTKLRSGRLDPKQIDQLEKEYEELVQKRLDIMLDRKTQTQEQQVPSKQDPFAYVKPEPQGIGDIQDPKAKMAQLAQQTKKGPLANVGAGLKAFIKGEPEPMGEQQEVNPRALGVANFQRLVKANMGNIPTVNLEFIRPEENFKLDQKGLDLISDYYDGLESDQAKNYFIYRVLPSGDETKKILRQIGWTTQQVQPPLPGIPTQGELPLQEKKKSNSDDLKAGDVKVARELQKLRAQYPAARSDVEAVARAEIDSTERSQKQLSAIRGANEKQDALLKQLVALDQQQGQEIDGLDKENNSLEQRLAQVQSTNDRLQQAVGKMTGTKKTATKTKAADVPQTVSRDIAQGGIIDVGSPVPSEPNTPLATKPEPTTSPAVAAMARQIQGLAQPAPGIRPAPDIGKDASNDPGQQTQKRAEDSRIKEHGGGIGPRQHWQDLMQEGQPQELINRYLAIDAENDVDAVRAAIQAISRDPALGANSKSRLLGQIGMIIKRHRLPIGRSYYQFMQQYMEEQSVIETVTDVRPLWAKTYHKLAPKIERHRDSFLAGQLYDELENIAELHGAEGEFRRMMNGARNRAHMEYDTNPGGFHNWFWFLPFEDEQVEEGFEYASKVQHPKYGSGQVVKVYSNGMITVNFPTFLDPIDKKPGVQTNFMPGDAGYNSLKSNMVESTDDIKKRMSKLEALALAANRAGDDTKCKMYQQKIQSLKQKLSQSMTEGLKSGEYYIHTVYFKDGTKKRIRVTSDEFDVVGYYKQRGQAVDRVDYDFQIHSDVTEDLVEGIKDTASATAVIACLLTGGSLTGCATAPQQTSAQQVLKTGQDIGRTVQTAKKITRAGTEAEVQQELRNILRGINRPEELNHSNIIRIWKRIKGQPPVQPEPQAPEYGPADPVKRSATFEAKEIQTREDFIRERDRLLRMIGIETDPANKQILKSAIRQLENRAENEGWITIQSRMVREDSDDGEAVEMAIMRRMLVAHTDLIIKFGLDKVVDAIEEVAYDVGDVDEIGPSDVSGWVRQVERILGVEA